MGTKATVVLRWASIFASIGAVAFSALAVVRLVNPSAKEINPERCPLTSAEILGGRNSSPVTLTTPVLVEFGDYECPPCRTLHPKIRAFFQSAHERLSFQFRNYPLTSLHPKALAAATAAEAFGLEGHFDEAHDTLMSSYPDEETISSLRRRLHVDAKEFERDRRLALQRVKGDVAIAKKLNVKGAPTLIVCLPNGNAYFVESPDQMAVLLRD
jgi:protein-disulfide isomerase